jgi:hypothetical protein
MGDNKIILKSVRRYTLDSSTSAQGFLVTPEDLSFPLPKKGMEFFIS